MHVLNAAGVPERRHPATAAFVRAHVEDWSKSPYIGGAYSYPSLGARPGDRWVLSCTLALIWPLMCLLYIFLSLKHATLCDKAWNCLSGIYPACQEVQLHIPALHEQLRSFYMQNLGRFSVLIVCWQGLSGRARGRCAVLCWGGNASCGQPVHASCFGDR